jgi:hypothetical protein
MRDRYRDDETESDFPLTHVGGSEVTTVTEPDSDGICTIACKDGKTYKYNHKTKEVR